MSSVAFTEATDPGGVLFTWSALANSQTGTPVPANPATVKIRSAFFEATGTWGSGGSVQIEGSNDGVNFYKLSPAALTQAGIAAPAELPRYFRPNCTGGDGSTAITVTAYFTG